ncbi:GntR family transcriptional regulator [Algicella marina]|nr:GntR family transcriptional regulator [Algicella marina]
MAELSKKRSFQRALEQLRCDVMAGRFDSGQKLSETSLASAIGVSRTPLREAIAQLVEEGLLERMPSGGTRVRRMTRADVADTIELRGTLEGLALRRAAEAGVDAGRLRGCSDILDRIDVLLQASENTFDFNGYARANEAFHTALLALCPSSVLAEEVTRVSLMPLAGPSSFLGGQAEQPELRRSLQVAQAQHRAMVEAVAARESARAEALAREHARLARSNLEFFLGEGVGQADRIPGFALLSTAAE